MPAYCNPGLEALHQKTYRIVNGIQVKGIARNRRYVRMAYDWHSGGGSPFYAFASTGGIVQSLKHLEDLLNEAEGNAMHASTTLEQVRRMEGFARWLRQVQERAGE